MSKKLVLNPLTGQFDLIDQVTATAAGSAPNSAGVSISADNAVTLQPADASNPGIISTGAQAIAGSKTFSAVTYTDGGIDLSTSGTLSLGTSANATTINIGHSGATVNILGTTLYENVSELAVTDPLITINKSGAAGSGANSGIEINENNVITGYAETSADRNSWILKAPNTAGVATITPGTSGITIAGSITGGTTSGTNTGDQTITLTSDVTGTGTGSFAATIAANAVTNAKAAQMSANTLKGNNTGSTANASDLTVSQAQTLLSVPTSSSPLALNAGGTGTSAASAGAALNALMPSQGAHAGQFLVTDGTNPAWVSAASQPYELNNLGLSVSVASNALTIALKQSDGSTDPSTALGGVVGIGFRSSTASSGAYTVRFASSALSLVVPSGATLGSGSGVTQFYYVYAIDNAGAIELAVAGSKLFDDAALQNTTAISSSSNAGNVLYSTTARTAVPVRLIGRFKVNEATAGTWATTPSDLTVKNANIDIIYSSYVSTSSSVKTPVASPTWLSMSGNAVVLTPGTWLIVGKIYFSYNPSGAGYSYFDAMYSATNGTDTSTAPTGISLDAGNHSAITDFPTGTFNQMMLNLMPVRYTTATTITIYLVPYANMTTPANARVTAFIYAERLR